MDTYDQLLEAMLESEKIRKMYDEYIVKDITFREWVVDHLDEALIGAQKWKSHAKNV